MISRDSVQTLLGGTAYSTDGDKIGSIGQVYLDNVSGEPAWVTVKTGLFGSNESFVPLEQAELTEDGVRVPYDKERVKGAPNVETERELSEEEEDRLYAYYGLGTNGAGEGYAPGTTAAGHDTGLGTPDSPTRYAGYDAGTTPGSNPTLTTSDATDSTTDTTPESDAGYGGGAGGYQETSGAATGAAGTYETQARMGASDTAHDTGGQTTDDAMTRSEERVRTGTQTREAGRARLRKYVVTEQQQVSVPVTREEVRVEREPITEDNYDKAMDGPTLSEEEHKVVLHEERPVVTTEAVPVERVRLTKDQVQDEKTVDVDVRREEIETEADAGPGQTALRDDGDVHP